ncbi:hypothetical protein WH96_09955 [Kiloniella spongiae]|uniref:Uncharacterized protein n=1 Tax=Kiloniella spongiae TaxID=1489064 RepID=A0A0H2MVP4_9PROT|nr:hypothetical protein [Kiloniella spongiae]KLN60790.1 hypothetical protein WH96_09955 [Kiloniella spongiae]
MKSSISNHSIFLIGIVAITLSMTLMVTKANAKQVQCREYQTKVLVGGKKENAYGTACLKPDGSWQIQKDAKGNAQLKTGYARQRTQDTRVIVMPASEVEMMYYDDALIVVDEYWYDEPEIFYYDEPETYVFIDDYSDEEVYIVDDGYDDVIILD